MGSALTAALLNKGFITTVWNRTAAKTEPLSRLAKDILEAVGQADVVIVNINNCDSTMQLLRIASALRGKIFVQLSSGTPTRQERCNPGPGHSGSNTSTAPS
jgi:3-hydroxyisobutyrate dehydrogenase-like beta-hydroxyacid dehydrogenase